MYWLMTCLMVLILTAGTVAVSVAEVSTPPQTVKGNLLTIEGDVYMIRDVLGRFIRVRVNKNTKQERVLAPGEQVEARILQDGRALSIKHAQ